jgi:hypothetical protein
MAGDAWVGRVVGVCGGDHGDAGGEPGGGDLAGAQAADEERGLAVCDDEIEAAPVVGVEAGQGAGCGGGGGVAQGEQGKLTAAAFAGLGA